MKTMTTPHDLETEIRETLAKALDLATDRYEPDEMAGPWWDAVRQVAGRPPFSVTPSRPDPQPRTFLELPLWQVIAISATVGAVAMAIVLALAGV